VIYLWIVVVIMIPFIFLAFNASTTAARRIGQLESRVHSLEKEFGEELVLGQAAPPEPVPAAPTLVAFAPSAPSPSKPTALGYTCRSCGAVGQTGLYCLSCGAYLQESLFPKSRTAQAGRALPLSPTEGIATSGTGAAAAGVTGSDEPTYPAPPYRQPRPSLMDRVWTRFRETKDWEALVGGHLLNRIGAIALVLGLGLFFKYAIDNNWISEPLRVGIGVAVGLGSLALAARTNRRGLPIFAQGLVGAGIAILYVSVYASYNFYHLVPTLVALAAMLAVTAIGFQQALQYDSLAVSLLSLFGGFLAPLIESRLHPNEYGLFAYVFLLAAGVMAIASRKPRWFILEPLTLLGTYLSYLLWYESSYRPSEWFSTLALLTLLWLPFFVFDVYLVGRGPIQGDELSRIPALQRHAREFRHVLAAINGIVYYIGLYTLIAPHHYPWVAPATAAFAAVYALTTFYAVGRSHVDSATVIRQALSAIVLAVLAPPLAFHGIGISIAWTLEGLVLVAMGSYWKRSFLWAPGIAVYVLAAGRLLTLRETYGFISVARFVPAINDRAGTVVLLSAAMAVSAWLLQRVEHPRITTVRQMLIYASAAASFLFLTVETNDLFRRLMLHTHGNEMSRLSYDRYLGLSLVWMAFALPLIWVGLKRRVQRDSSTFNVQRSTMPSSEIAPDATRLSRTTVRGAVLWSGVAATGAAIGMAAIVGARFQPISTFEPILNVRFGLLALVLGGLFVQYRWLKARIDEHPAYLKLARGVQVAMASLGFELMTAEVNDFFQHRAAAHTVAGEALFVEIMVLAAIWIAYSLPLIWAGIHRRATPLLACGIISAAAAVLAGTIEGVTFQPHIAFAEILGLRAGIFLLLVTCMLVELQWIRTRQDLGEWLGPVIYAFQAAVVIVGLALISVETRDIFGYVIQPSPSSAVARDANHLRNLEQLTLSLVWLTYAIGILIAGIWRRIRWLRLGAITLFGFIIIKIFAYDLGFLQAGLRSISFVVLGLILLAVSYLYQRYRALLLEPAA
jgi:uncharacterized membrane protein